MSRIETLRAYLGTKPTDRFALYALALEYRKAGMMTEAKAAFSYLLEHHPKSGAGHYQLGLFYRDQGDLDGARRAWTMGLTLLSDAPDAESARSRGEIQRELDALDG